MKYPILLHVEKDAQTGKISCICANSGVDYTSEVTWITKQNAAKNGNDLYKASAVEKFKQVAKGSTAPSASTKEPAKAKKAAIKVSSTNMKEPLQMPENVMQFIHDEAISKKPNDLVMNPLTWKVICRNILRGKNILLTGPSGCGKSQTAFAAADAMGRELFYINLGATQDPRGALIGNTHYAKDAGTFFSESAFVRAIQTPNTVILLDEVSRAHPEAWNILMTVLDPKQRYLRLDEAVGTPIIKVAEGVSFIGTANVGSEFTSTRVLDRALMDRFSMVEVPYLSAKEEAQLIEYLYPNLKGSVFPLAIASIASTTRDEVRSESSRISTAVSTRVSLEMAELLADGFTLPEAAEVTIYPFYSDQGGLNSERTFIKQLVQKYVSDQTAEDLVDAPIADFVAMA